MLHTSVSQTSEFILDDAERLRRLQAVCRRDLSILAGLDDSGVGRQALQLVLGSRVRRFARAMAAFNRDIARCGLPDASRTLCAYFGARIAPAGVEHVPSAGPVLFAANHPGLMDTLAIYATVPRPDIRALARPQPMLGLLSELAPNLLILPDDGPSRAGGLRNVLRTLRSNGALLLFPAGRLEPEPTFLPMKRLRERLAARTEPLPHPVPEGNGTIQGRASWCEPLAEWSSGIGTLVRLAARQDVPLQVVPTSISGVLSQATRRRFGPLLRLRRTHRGREDLTAVLQLAFPSLGSTTIRVRYGHPLAVGTLAGGGADADAITAQIRDAVCAQLCTSDEPGA
jgi:1-acyl-sn-glycerol-3-phosphate acyltransferase